jgi:hypothetical protein
MQHDRRARAGDLQAQDLSQCPSPLIPWGLTRPSPCSPYPALHAASASAVINALVNVVDIERSWSGDDEASCSCGKRAE